MYEVDELKIYRGSDIPITPKITITQPTLQQIIDFGESKYFNVVYTITGAPADFKWQLLDYMDIDYTEIDDYTLFVKYVWPTLCSRRKLKKELERGDYTLEDFGVDDIVFTEDDDINPTELLLKDIDLADFDMCMVNGDEDNIVLYDSENDITIDRFVYTKMVEAFRTMHGLKRNNEKPGNEATKQILIEDARDEARKLSEKPRKSTLKPLISALMAEQHMCGDDRLWDMKINMFFDSIKRITKIQESTLLLQGAYSGFASLKGVDKKRLDWTGDL